MKFIILSVNFTKRCSTRSWVVIPTPIKNLSMILRFPYTVTNRRPVYMTRTSVAIWFCSHLTRGTIIRRADITEFHVWSSLLSNIIIVHYRLFLSFAWIHYCYKRFHSFTSVWWSLGPFTHHHHLHRPISVTIALKWVLKGFCTNQVQTVVMS